MLPLWPTMMDDRIGTIGSTQGVSDSTTPARKKALTTCQKAPVRSAASVPTVPAGDAVLIATDAADEVSSAGAAPAIDISRPGSTRTLPLPPKPIRLTSARIWAGG